MVKAAENFNYGKDFYKEGDEIPESLIPELEKYHAYVLSTFVNVNGTWHKIDDPKVAGWIQQRKHLEKRLINYFKTENEKPKIPEESNMLRSRPKRLLKEEFIKLNRKEQEKELTIHGIEFSKKDKEDDLFDKYIG